MPGTSLLVLIGLLSSFKALILFPLLSTIALICQDFTGIISLMNPPKSLVILIGACFLPILFSACSTGSPISSVAPLTKTVNATLTRTPEPTATSVPPTSTPVPLAATVNGEGITLEEYQAELDRFTSARVITGTILATDTHTIVLDELIDQTLLAQAAKENGYSVDDTLLQSKIDALQNQLGGAQALHAWETANGYTEASFTVALKRSVAAAWMRDQIINAVPQTADQVHVLQILLPTQAEADQVYASLQSGKDFQQVATAYAPETGGDLGWFPRGYLNQPAIEEAAFGLSPGQYSSVIKTDLGYHILYLLERDAQHPLQPDARRALQSIALQAWISDRRQQSEIQILLP